jgi:uncharacterized membrane protein YjdF
MAMNDPTRAHRVVAVVATVMMIALSVAAPSGSTYRYSFLFLSPLVWGVYALRHRLCLRPFHLGLFASALLLHNLGVFRFYRRTFWNLEFDTYVHFYFGLCGAAMARQGLSCAYGLTRWRLWAAVILCILGFGAIHELIEWGSTMLLGSERGMLKLIEDDLYDTQKDLLNNFLGTLTALTCAALYQRIRKPRVGEPAKNTGTEPSSTRPG